MKHNRQEFIWMIMILILLVSPGCSLRYIPQSGEEFKRETLRLEEKARSHEDPEVRAECQLELAYLYLNHRNPLLNYGKALQGFEAYLSFTGADRQTEEIQNWTLALREMGRRERETASLKERVAKLVQDMERRERETASLQEKFAKLAQDNEGKGKSLAWQVKKNQESQAALEKLHAQVDSLERTNRSLKEANEKMKETVEKLKNLDLQMEEKRKAIK
jgi:uncharacterized protein YoxC